jgi:lysozyme
MAGGSLENYNFYYSTKIIYRPNCLCIQNRNTFTFADYYLPMLSTKRKKNLQRLALTTVLFFLILLVCFILYQRINYNKAKFARYPEFGIQLPLGYDIHGIDVSKFQSAIAWEEVKKMNIRGVKMWFAFIKATEGNTNDDPQFNRNWKLSKQHGLIRGAYHFFIASRDGETQAQHFIEKVTLNKGDLPPVLDIEQLNGTSPERLRQEAIKWLDIVEAHYKVKPIIYTNVDFYKNYLGEDFDQYPFWAAHYKTQDKPRINRNWIFWQHSDEGNINGIIGNVDFNVFNGDIYDLKKLLLR